MTGFETATLAFHAASLGWQEVSAWATVGGVAIGIVQCLLIAWGLRLMQQNASARDAGIAAARADPGAPAPSPETLVGPIVSEAGIAGEAAPTRTAHTSTAHTGTAQRTAPSEIPLIASPRSGRRRGRPRQRAAPIPVPHRAQPRRAILPRVIRRSIGPAPKACRRLAVRMRWRIALVNARGRARR